SDHDLVAVDAELIGMVRGPQQTRVAVVERRGIRILRREAVIDGHRYALELFDPTVEPRVDREPRSEHVAAAMDPVDARPPRSRGRRRVHTDRRIVTGGAGDDDLARDGGGRR